MALIPRHVAFVPTKLPHFRLSYTIKTTKLQAWGLMY